MRPLHLMMQRQDIGPLISYPDMEAIGLCSSAWLRANAPTALTSKLIYCSPSLPSCRSDDPARILPDVR